MDTENRLWACGTNNSGTLGQGNTDIYQNFVQIENIDGSQIEKIAVSTEQHGDSAFIIYTNGEVYVAGDNNYGSLGIGNRVDQKSFIKLSDYNNSITNVKEVKTTGIQTFLLKENGELWGAGYNSNGTLGTGDTTMKTTWTKIAENIEQIEYYNGLICKDSSGNIYSIYNSNINRVINIEANPTNEISSGRIVISNGEMYLISSDTNTATIFGSYTNAEAVEAEGLRKVFKIEGKIYAESLPDITKPSQKSIYELKTIFENAIFMQGTSSQISIVSKNGEIYENLVKNAELQNISQLISSSTSRYAITNDGKLYWAGTTSYTALPNIQGDFVTSGSGTVTKYPKEVSTPIIDEIKSKIEDIEYSFINAGGVSARVTYIITENGELYVYGNNANATGTGRTSSDFEQLIIKEGTTVVDVKTADGLTLAVLSNGEIYGWGYNTYGILGDGYEVGGIYPTPVKLDLPNNIRSVSLGTGFAIFASNTGEVYGIGKNDYGQLGTGDNKGASTFVRCTELEK